MKIFDSETFLTKQLIEEVSYSQKLEHRLKVQPMNDREVFCLMLHEFCKYLYEHNQATIREKKYFKENFKRRQDGWYSIQKSFGKGKFVNANRLLSDVYCAENKCHVCAYQFALSYSGDVTLKFGRINPFTVGDGLLHSICVFNYDDKEYVFDGSSYLVMDKDFYYKCFKFSEIQTLSQSEIRGDRRCLKMPLLKSNNGYKYSSQTQLSKRFYGLGFLAYLCDRNDFLRHTDNQIKNFNTIKKQYESFEKRLDKMRAEIYNNSSDPDDNERYF